MCALRCRCPSSLLLTAVCAQPVPKQRWQSLIFSSNCSRTIWAVCSASAISRAGKSFSSSFSWERLRMLHHSTAEEQPTSTRNYQFSSTLKICVLFSSRLSYFFLSASSLTADDSREEVEDEEHFSLSSAKKKHSITSKENWDSLKEFEEKFLRVCISLLLCALLRRSETCVDT